MSISFKSCKNNLINKTYAELIEERNSLISSIRSYEKINDVKNTSDKDFSSEYHSNLMFLSAVCERLANVYYNKIKTGYTSHYKWIYELKDYLDSSGISNYPLVDKIIERRAGKNFSLSEHVEALVFSLLSNQRPWSGISENYSEIKSIFFDFDIEKIKKTEPEYFINSLCEIKCGNRDISNQMKSLADNISVMENIENLYGTMDDFLISKPASEVVKMISSSSSQFKLKRVGEALAWEYLRNIGIDGCKPDVHLCRFLGKERIGYSKNSIATPSEVCRIVDNISEETGYLLAEIDSIIWSFCSLGNAETCALNPRCNICPIKSYCNYDNK